MRTTRKTLIIVLLILALCGLSALPQRGAQAEPVNPGTSGLVSWWSLDETSGTRNDSHGANHLTDNNTVGYATGVKNNAASFVSANSEYLSRADNANLSTGNIDFTFCMWVYMTDKSTVSFRYYGGKWDASTNNREYVIGYRLSSDRFEFVVSSNGTNTAAIVSNTFGSPSINTWYYICGSHNATDDVIKIRVNGSSDSTSYSSGVYDGNAIMSIGGNSLGYADGRVDEVSFYKKYLSDDEYIWLYNSGAGRTYSELIPTPTPPPSNTATFTPSNTATFTPSNTATFTPSNTATFTPSNTATFTPSKTSTPSNTPTITNTVPGPTSTFTDTPTPSDTPTPTATATETMTPTITFTPTITSTPTITRTPGNFATAFWDGAITYGDTANVIVTSLICLILIVALMAWLVTTNLQRKRK